MIEWIEGKGMEGIAIGMWEWAIALADAAAHHHSPKMDFRRVKNGSPQLKQILIT
jgi:hypothetical protein